MNQRNGSLVALIHHAEKNLELKAAKLSNLKRALSRSSDCLVVLRNVRWREIVFNHLNRFDLI